MTCGFLGSSVSFSAEIAAKSFMEMIRSRGVAALYSVRPKKSEELHGTTLHYSAYIGGSGSDVLTRIAVDPTGNAWVSGTSTGIGYETRRCNLMID
jgi:hypothetical protein